MKKGKNILLLTVMLAAGFVLAACSNTSPAGKTSTENVSTSMEKTLSAEETSDNNNEESNRESEGTETKAAEPETTESENEAPETLESEMMEISKDGNILIAYYSHTGNTEEAAQKIAELTGGELAEIKRAEEYEDLYEEAEAEILDGVHPEITVSRDNIEEYDTIFVGYPKMEQPFLGV